MQELLEKINRIKGVRGSGIASKDGIEVVSLFRSPVAFELLSALVASVQQVTEKIVDTAKDGKFQQTMIESTEGRFFIQAVELGYLIVLADAQANIGLVRVELAQVAPMIR